MPALNLADDVKLGVSQVDKVYLGSNLVWEPAPVGGGITVVSWTEIQAFSDVTSLTLDRPPDLADDDVLVFAVGVDDDDNTVAASGFTEILQVATPVGRDMTLAVFYKIVTDAGSEPSTYTTTITGGVSTSASAYMLALRGVDLTNIQDVTAATSVVNSSAGIGVPGTAASPEITTVTDDALVLRIASSSSSNGAYDIGLTAPSAPSGATSDTMDQGLGAGDITMGFQHFTQAAGATGTDNWTRTNHDLGLTVLATLAFRPAPGGGDPPPGPLEGPFNIALMVQNPGTPAALDVSLYDWLVAEGHTVTYFDAATAGVNSTNNPTIDLMIFGPNNDYTLEYPLWLCDIPVVDFAKNSWYRRGVLPWDDSIVGTREGGGTQWGQTVNYHTTGVIDWDGQATTGIVDIADADQWSNPCWAETVMQHSCGGDLVPFLSLGDDASALGVAGGFLPAGSTVTEPAPTIGAEVQYTSTANWVGFAAYTQAATQISGLNAAGDALIRALILKAVNG